MKNLSPRLGEFIPRIFSMIPARIFWNFFDFIVLCSILILGVTVYQQRQEIAGLKAKVDGVQHYMKALHQDFMILEGSYFDNFKYFHKRILKVEKDRRPEIHIHGKQDGSVKVYNVSGEIVVETIEGLKVIRKNTRYKK